MFSGVNSEKKKSFEPDTTASLTRDSHDAAKTVLPARVAARSDASRRLRFTKVGLGEHVLRVLSEVAREALDCLRLIVFLAFECPVAGVSRLGLVLPQLGFKKKGKVCEGVEP